MSSNSKYYFDKNEKYYFLTANYKNKLIRKEFCTQQEVNDFIFEYLTYDNDYSDLEIIEEEKLRAELCVTTEKVPHVRTNLRSLMCGEAYSTDNPVYERYQNNSIPFQYKSAYKLVA